MAYRNIQEFISKLECENELIRIKGFVDPILEIAEITDRFSKEPDGGKALLFENTGTLFPVITNAFGSNRRICLALGIENFEELSVRIKEMLDIISAADKSIFNKIKVIPQLNKIRNWLPYIIKRKGACQQVIDLNPDLYKLPILKCWPADGGQFITLPMVHTLDPISGIRNVGMYRMQIFGPDTTGMHWHCHKTGARHYEEYKKLNKKMPIAVTLGGNPVYTYCATAPLPDQIDEYLLAGFIREKPVELIKCITQDMYVPSDVDFVIEGYVDPNENLVTEGPFGDHTGFYSLPDLYPKFHVTCITHRNDAVYPATIVGIPPQEDAWIAMATEKLFFLPMKMSLANEMTDLHLPPAGVAHNLALLKIQKRYPGQAFKVINSLWGAGQMMFNKVMVVVDESYNIRDYYECLKYIIKNIRIPDDLLYSRGPLDILDHAADIPAFGGKIGIDATSKPANDIKSTAKSNISSLLNKEEYIDIQMINTDYVKNDIPLLLLNFKQKISENPLEILKRISLEPDLGEIKVIIGFNSDVDIFDHYLATWLCLNNIDINRDCYIQIRDTFTENCMLVDATIKTYKLHGFKRFWPNVTVSNDETIKKIDNKWGQLFTFNLIQSPSNKYQSLLKNKDAIAYNNCFE